MMTPEILPMPPRMETPPTTQAAGLEVRELGPGDIWYVPSSVVHGVEYVGDVEALEIVSPIRLDNFTGYVARHTFFEESQKQAPG